MLDVHIDGDNPFEAKDLLEVESKLLEWNGGKLKDKIWNGEHHQIIWKTDIGQLLNVTVKGNNHGH